MSILTIAILSAATAITPSSVPSSPDAALLVIERNIVQRTNRQRAQHGLPPLQIDHQLMQSARQQAMHMARRRIMQHTQAAVAENIAAGQSSSREVVQDWMQSPGHRANILNGGYRKIGAAAYRGADGQIYWCQQFVW